MQSKEGRKDTRAVSESLFQLLSFSIYRGDMPGYYIRNHSRLLDANPSYFGIFGNQNVTRGNLKPYGAHYYLVPCPLAHPCHPGESAQWGSSTPAIPSVLS